MCGRVGSCCFLTDLRLATMIIAGVSLLENVAVLAFTSWGITVMRRYAGELLNEGQCTLTSDSLFRVSLSLLMAIVLVSIAAVLLDVGLFFGALTCHRVTLQSWTQGHAFVSGAYLFYFWTSLVGIFSNGYIVYGFIFLAACIIGAVLSAYFWVVVRSLDYELYQMKLRTVYGSCSPKLTSPLPTPAFASPRLHIIHQHVSLSAAPSH